MTEKELEYISDWGINPVNEGPKEIFEKLVCEYKEAFEQKFGKPTIIKGLEIYSHKGRYFIYCQPFANGQYSRSFRFGIDEYSSEGSMGKYGEFSYAHTQVEIPCHMCTTDSAKVFPVKMISFKITDGEVVPVVSKTTSLINTGRTYNLSKGETVSIYDDLLMVSSFGIINIQTGDLLYRCDGDHVHFSKNELSMRDPNSFSGATINIPLDVVYSKIKSRVDDNRKLAQFGLTCSDFKSACEVMGKEKYNYKSVER